MKEEKKTSNLNSGITYKRKLNIINDEKNLYYKNNKDVKINFVRKMGKRFQTKKLFIVSILFIIND